MIITEHISLALNSKGADNKTMNSRKASFCKNEVICLQADVKNKSHN